MADAEISAYHPTWRDKIASWLIGDGRPSATRSRFVDGLMGSTGVSTGRISLSDLSPLGMVFALQEGWRSYDNGAYGDATLDLAGTVPIGRPLRLVKSARKTANPLGSVSAKAASDSLEQTKNISVEAADRSLGREQTRVIKTLQAAGHSPEEIRQALSEFHNGPGDIRKAQRTAPDLPLAADALPTNDKVVSTDVAGAAPRLSPSAAHWGDGRVPGYSDYGAILDRHELKFYDDGPSKWVGPLGAHQGPTISQPYDMLLKRRKEAKRNGDDKILDAHHLFQKAASWDLPGYRWTKAPSVLLGGPSNVKATEHYLATLVQREAGGGTVGAELAIVAKALGATGTISPAHRHQVMMELIQYLKYHGYTSDTPTRIPKNRRKK